MATLRLRVVGPLFPVLDSRFERLDPGLERATGLVQVWGRPVFGLRGDQIREYLSSLAERLHSSLTVFVNFAATRGRGPENRVVGARYTQDAGSEEAACVGRGGLFGLPLNSGPSQGRKRLALRGGSRALDAADPRRSRWWPTRHGLSTLFGFGRGWLWRHQSDGGEVRAPRAPATLADRASCAAWSA